MISNYALFIKETQGLNIIEDDKGFATYEILDDGIYVPEVFVREEHRKSNIGTDYVRKIAEIAKSLNKEYIYTSVNVTEKEDWESIIPIEKYGFKFLKEESMNNKLKFYIKEL